MPRLSHVGIVLLCLLGLSGLSRAQSATATPPSVESGTRFTGRLDNATPRQTYTFEGLRGEVLRLRLSALNGDLDPVLALFDSQGMLVLSRDDSESSTDIFVTLTLQRDDLYLLVVGRYGYGLGTTAGEYELLLERIGIQSIEGASLRYGVPILSTISHAQAQHYFTFRARAGDILDIEMVRSSGTLDPSLKVLDADQFLIASNDDADETTRNAAIRNLFIERDGVYIIVATRYGEEAGDSVGSFVLSVGTADNSGVGNSSRAPANLVYNQTVEGSISAQQVERYYRFSAQEDDLVTISVNQLSGRLDAFVTLADVNLNPLRSDDDSGGGKNARIDRFRIPSTGIYVIIVTRFNGTAGDTEGGYRLNLQKQGTAYEGVPADMPRLLYGTSFTDSIRAEDSESLYAFWGEQGDIITARMARSSGTLDPALELLDAQQRRLFRADGTAPIAELTRLTLPYTGVYYLYARRYEGSLRPADTTGEFLMTLVKLGTANATPSP